MHCGQCSIWPCMTGGSDSSERYFSQAGNYGEISGTGDDASEQSRDMCGVCAEPAAATAYPGSLPNIRPADILRVAEGSLAPVACLEDSVNQCPRASECPTLGFWEGLSDVVNQYVDSITLEDLVHRAGDSHNFSI